MPIPTPGHDCPDFDLPETDGGRVTKASLSGKPFVLFFYPKDDTSGCTLEAIEFTALMNAFDEVGTPVFGVSPDPVKQHCKFRDKHELKVKLLSDEEKSLLEAFDVWVQKSMYGKTYMGVERTTALVAADGRIARIWPKVKVPGHAQEVLDAARALSGATAS